MRQLLAQLPQRSELTDEAREEIHEAAEEIHEVITGPDPKPSKVRRMVGVLGRVAATLGQGALQGAAGRLQLLESWAATEERDQRPAGEGVLDVGRDGGRG